MLFLYRTFLIARFSERTFYIQTNPQSFRCLPDLGNTGKKSFTTLYTDSYLTTVDSRVSFTIWFSETINPFKKIKKNPRFLLSSNIRTNEREKVPARQTLVYEVHNVSLSHSSTVQHQIPLSIHEQSTTLTSFAVNNPNPQHSLPHRSN